MAIDRRRFLGLAASLPLAAITPFAGLPSLGMVARAAEGEPLYATCCRLPDGRFAVALIDLEGRVHSSEILAARGHSLAVDGSGRWIVAFARRPGTFAVALDRETGRAVHAFSTPAGRHFEGHGVFSPDGRLLYATENAYDDGIAVVGIYDATAGFARVGELDGHGIGSHELLLDPDGETLIVANGGIYTHPDYPRANLDLAAMEPSLVRIDRRTGDLRDKAEPPGDLRQLSMRHMAVDGAGRTWIGCQWWGDKAEAVPLVAVHEAGKPLQFVEMTAHQRLSLGQYIGSVAANVAGDRIVLASPVGSTVMVFDTATRAIIESRDLADGCGAAPAPESGFVLTSGEGAVIVERDGAETRHDSDISWDNHIRRL